MASSETLLFVFSIIDGTALLFLTVYVIITLSDLECDYINARTCCDKLNKWVLVELVAFGSLCCALIFLNFHIFLFLLNLPLLVWLIYRYVTVPEGNTGAYDPTEIHNRLRLKSYMKEAMIKLTYHLIFFFIYLYSMIMALLA